MTKEKEVKIISISERESKALAATVVAHRAIGFCKQEAVAAMEELLVRKINGDTFDYNSYIEEKIKEMPEPTIGEKQIESFKAVLRNVKTGTV